MPKLKIVKGESEPVLRKVAEPVVNFDGGLKKFAKDMKKAMEGANGMGIAAPQVGESVRVFWVVFDVRKPSERAICMVNPVILERSAELEVDEEGCLSLPGRYGKVARAAKVKVEFQDLDGARQVLDLEGLNARVVQHELDHLNGVLFIDKLAE